MLVADDAYQLCDRFSSLYRTDHAMMVASDNISILCLLLLLLLPLPDHQGSGPQSAGAGWQPNTAAAAAAAYHCCCCCRRLQIIKAQDPNVLVLVDTKQHCCHCRCCCYHCCCCCCHLQIIKAQDVNVLVLVDNCYGEFTEEQEPTAVGAGGAKGLYGCQNPVHDTE
jgi:hypothetical protein